MALELVLIRRMPDGRYVPWSSAVWDDYVGLNGEREFDQWHNVDVQPPRAVYSTPPGSPEHAGECFGFYWRPADFAASRLFVSEMAVPRGNRDRFLALLNELDANDDLWLYTSV